MDDTLYDTVYDPPLPDAPLPTTDAEFIEYCRWLTDEWLPAIIERKAEQARRAKQAARPLRLVAGGPSAPAPEQQPRARLVALPTPHDN
jgi:hypothetical protein